VDWFSVPRLRVSGPIYTPEATTFNAQQLQFSGPIFAPSAILASAPLLQTSGHFCLSRAIDFKVSQLALRARVMEKLAELAALA
jgi:hypothetical protein